MEENLESWLNNMYLFVANNRWIAKRLTVLSIPNSTKIVITIIIWPVSTSTICHWENLKSMHSDCVGGHKTKQPKRHDTLKNTLHMSRSAALTEHTGRCTDQSCARLFKMTCMHSFLTSFAAALEILIDLSSIFWEPQNLVACVSAVSLIETSINCRRRLSLSPNIICINVHLLIYTLKVVSLWHAEEGERKLWAAPHSVVQVSSVQNTASSDNQGVLCHAYPSYLPKQMKLK